MMYAQTQIKESEVYLSHGYVPRPNDILCGRGKAHSTHEGNKIFLQLIRSSLQRYLNAASRIEKSVVVCSVVHSIFDAGIRFIKLDTDCNRYVELCSSRVHDKVGHAIRDLIKEANKKCPSNQQSKRAVRTSETIQANRLQNSVDECGTPVLIGSLTTTTTAFTTTEFSYTNSRSKTNKPVGNHKQTTCMQQRRTRSLQQCRVPSPTLMTIQPPANQTTWLGKTNSNLLYLSDLTFQAANDDNGRQGELGKIMQDLGYNSHLGGGDGEQHEDDRGFDVSDIFAAEIFSIEPPSSTILTPADGVFVKNSFSPLPLDSRPLHFDRQDIETLLAILDLNNHQ